jgi:hypothetical protein
MGGGIWLIRDGGGMGLLCDRDWRVGGAWRM